MTRDKVLRNSGASFFAEGYLVMGESFTLLVTGGESLASAIASACEETLECAPPFVAQKSMDPPAWRVIVRVRPTLSIPETDWMDVANALVSAFSSYDMTIEHPQERELRERLDRLWDRVWALLKAVPGASVHLVLPDRKPVPLKKVKSADLAWRLLG
ncbi:hypothetical protein [Fundidesulfovibrio soli]|uniref:hypothetical protein n=1 Tax=Fundidesulfovibrio soli TaxID=2922716 RepID=UPI001FAFBC9D|nr:hypothetical protein [Fundidesulfovibrio soli]